MHTLVVIVVLVIGLPVIWFLDPVRGGRIANEWARRRNAEGRGNFLTQPLWGADADPAEGSDSDQSSNQNAPRGPIGSIQNIWVRSLVVYLLGLAIILSDCLWRYHLSLLKTGLLVVGFTLVLPVLIVAKRRRRGLRDNTGAQDSDPST